MIPLRDTIRSRSHPIVTHFLIGINGILFLLQLSQGSELDRFIFIYGLVPSRYSNPHIAAYFTTVQQLFSFISFMFLHGGFLHLLGNMWTLHIFGDNVEDHLGHFRYVMFYLLCGIASGLTHLIFNIHSNLPTIGASGAIAGVMGAYFILHPKSKILTLIPIFFIPYFIEIPAFFFLGFWVVLQIINAAGSRGDMGGIAWWAHIGGFVLGILFLKIFNAIPSGPRMEKKTTNRLQMVRPERSVDDADIYGTIRITWHEALTGTRKLVTVPGGGQNRLLRIAVPPGTREGSLLRLRGMGKSLPDAQRGDLYLKVVIEPK